MDWGGALSLPREGTPRPGGGLDWSIAPELEQSCSEPLPQPDWAPLCGTWERVAGGGQGFAPDGLARRAGRPAPPDYGLSLTLRFAGPPGAAAERAAAGLLLRLGPERTTGCALAPERETRRIPCRRWQQ